MDGMVMPRNRPSALVALPKAPQPSFCRGSPVGSARQKQASDALVIGKLPLLSGAEGEAFPL